MFQYKLNIFAYLKCNNLLRKTDQCEGGFVFLSKTAEAVFGAKLGYFLFQHFVTLTSLQNISCFEGFVDGGKIWVKDSGPKVKTFLQRRRRRR